MYDTHTQFCRKRALFSRQRALYTRKRALYTFTPPDTRHPHTGLPQQSHIFPHKSPVFPPKSPISPPKSPIYIHTSRYTTRTHRSAATFSTGTLLCCCRIFSTTEVLQRGARLPSSTRSLKCDRSWVPALLKRATLRNCAICSILISGSRLRCRTATHCNTLQHTATHCNTLQHNCNTLQHHEIARYALS